MWEMSEGVRVVYYSTSSVTHSIVSPALTAYRLVGLRLGITRSTLANCFMNVTPLYLYMRRSLVSVGE